MDRLDLRLSWRALSLILAVVLIGCDTDPAMRSESARVPHIEPVAAPELRCTDCNLLLISVDTLRADRLGSYGYSRPTSPNLDALASKSLLFRDVLAQASSTVPSHKSIFSGLYVFEHRNRLDGRPVLAQLLASAGYRTGAFVDGGYLSREFGMDRGFETYFDADVAEGLEGAPHGLHVINPAAIAWMTEHSAQRFFAFVHTYDVHCPYAPPEPYRSMFTSDYVPPVDLGTRCGEDGYEGRILTEQDFAHVSALYDGGVRYLDAKLQELLDALERLGLEHKTVVVVTSDHGESLGEHGRIGHNGWFDEQLKVPLIIYDPTGPSFVSDTPAQSIDILPTLLGILGVDPPRSLSGVDLTATLRNAVGSDARTRLAQAGRAVSIRADGRWNLILLSGKRHALFDLTVDPLESVDLMEQETDVVTKLVDLYRKLQVPEREAPIHPADLDEAKRRRLRALGYMVE